MAKKRPTDPHDDKLRRQANPPAKPGPGSKEWPRGDVGTPLAARRFSDWLAMGGRDLRWFNGLSHDQQVEAWNHWFKISGGGSGANLRPEDLADVGGYLSGIEENHYLHPDGADVNLQRVRPWLTQTPEERKASEEAAAAAKKGSVEDEAGEIAKGASFGANLDDAYDDLVEELVFRPLAEPTVRRFVDAITQQTLGRRASAAERAAGIELFRNLERTGYDQDYRAGVLQGKIREARGEGEAAADEESDGFDPSIVSEYAGNLPPELQKGLEEATAPTESGAPTQADIDALKREGREGVEDLDEQAIKQLMEEEMRRRAPMEAAGVDLRGALGDFARALSGQVSIGQ